MNVVYDYLCKWEKLQQTIPRDNFQLHSKNLSWLNKPLRGCTYTENKPNDYDIKEIKPSKYPLKWNQRRSTEMRHLESTKKKRGGDKIQPYCIAHPQANAVYHNHIPMDTAENSYNVNWLQLKGWVQQTKERHTTK